MEAGLNPGAIAKKVKCGVSMVCRIDRPLTDRVDRDGGPIQVQQFQQQRNVRDLNPFRVGGDLAQRQAGFPGPGRNQIQRVLPAAASNEPRQVFAVNRDLLADLASHVVQSLLEATHELDRIE